MKWKLAAFASFLAISITSILLISLNQSPIYSNPIEADFYAHVLDKSEIMRNTKTLKMAKITLIGKDGVTARSWDQIDGISIFHDSSSQCNHVIVRIINDFMPDDVHKYYYQVDVFDDGATKYRGMVEL